MDTISQTAVISIVGLLLGFGVGWGVIKATVNSSVKDIKESAQKLGTVVIEMATMKAVQEAHSKVTDDHENRVRDLEKRVTVLEANQE